MHPRSFSEGKEGAVQGTRMARHRYRSQPTLQRSSRGVAGTLISLVLLAGVAVGAGALLSPLIASLASNPAETEGRLPDETFQVATTSSPTQAPAPAVQTEIAAPPAETPLIEASNPQPTAKPQKSAARPARLAKAATTPVKPAAVEESWEKQRREYEAAREVYDANERSEGRRWAEQNRIRIDRHCRAAEQRNAAFVEGCLAYVRSGKTASLQ